MCCACGGGQEPNSNPIPIDDLVYPVPDGQCTDTNFDAEGNMLGDSYGDVCSEYVGNSHWCGGYETSTFNSMAMCCECGGGCYGDDCDIPQIDSGVLIVDDEHFTIDDLEVAIEAMNTVKSDLVSGAHHPVMNLNHLANFVHWTEEFQIPYGYGQACKVRGTRQRYRYTGLNGEIKHKHDALIFYLNGDCDESEEVWLRFKRHERFWRKFATFYNGEKSEVEED